MPRPIMGFLALCALLAGAYWALPATAWSEGLYVAVPALAVLAIAWGVRRNRPRRPLPWVLIGLGVGSLLVGELIWWWLEATGRDPFPSAADYFYLAGYPAFAIALLLLVRERSPVRDRSGVLDAAIVSVAGALLMWVVLIEPSASDAESTLSERLWTIAYPAMDLLVLVILARLVFGLADRSPAMIMLAAGFGTQLVADLVYSVQELDGTYAAGGLLDVGWMAAYALLGAAVLDPSMGNPRAVAPSAMSVGPLRLAGLGVAALIPPGLTVWHEASSRGIATDSVGFAAAVAAGVAFGLALLRMWGLMSATRELTTRQDEQRFVSMIENSSDVITLVDELGIVRYASPSVEALFGTPADAATGRPLLEIIRIGDHRAAEAMLARAAELAEGGALDFEAGATRPDGSTRDLEIVVGRPRGDHLQGRLVVTVRDISERKRLEREIRHRAFHDELTGLANRALFLDRLEHALARARRAPEASIAVLFIDLDDFKGVNDGMGHDAGDELLCAVAARICECVRPGDTVARLGGDEFAVLIEQDADGASAVGRRILEMLALPLRVRELELAVLASVGVAIAGPSESPESILRDADIAMYEAKRTGKGRLAVSDPSLRERAAGRLALRADLGAALGLEQFRLVFQPIYSLADRALEGAEALLRWQHPLRGDVSPAEFVPMAEENGLIVPIGEWVMRTACREAAGWTSAGAPLSLSVNASGRQLADPGFVAVVRESLQESGLPATRLVLEITETVLMHEPEAVRLVLDELRALGVRVAIDDFGTGYCSLSYLQKYPVDIVKIDRSFVSELGADHDESTLAGAILRMTEALALTSVAEGIESPAQVERLRVLACDLGQGYELEAPMELDDWRSLLRRERAATV